jgi:hypothetical protein
MNLLDENIPLEQRDLLQVWGFPCRVIGQDIAVLSIGDDNILTLLHHLKQPTLFTRDLHFFRRHLCHAGYALVFLDLAPEESAVFIRRFLHHPRFKTKARRMGIVARVHHDGVHFWQRNRPTLQRTGWSAVP